MVSWGAGGQEGCSSYETSVGFYPPEHLDASENFSTSTQTLNPMASATLKLARVHKTCANTPKWIFKKLHQSVFPTLVLFQTSVWSCCFTWVTQVMCFCLLFSCFSSFFFPPSNLFSAEKNKTPQDSFICMKWKKWTFIDFWFVLSLKWRLATWMLTLVPLNKNVITVYIRLYKTAAERIPHLGRSFHVPSPDLPPRPHPSPLRWLAWPQVSCSNTRAHLQSNSLQLLPG